MVLDASVLIGHLDANDVHHERATTFLLDLEDEPLAASQLTLAEVLVGPARAGRLAAARAALQLLDLVPVRLDGEIYLRLALWRSQTGLKLPDCCVLAAAEMTQGAIATFDQRLAEAARRVQFNVAAI